MVDSVQDEMKKDIKSWLKSNKLDYEWLAKKCYVTETTVRNWMARKPIPLSKLFIIKELIKRSPQASAAAIQVEDETLLTIKLSASTRACLEKKAAQEGKPFVDFLAQEILKMATIN